LVVAVAAVVAVDVAAGISIVVGSRVCKGCYSMQSVKGKKDGDGDDEFVKSNTTGAYDKDEGDETAEQAFMFDCLVE
jgi:hypothetical protein